MSPTEKVIPEPTRRDPLDGVAPADGPDNSGPYQRPGGAAALEDPRVILAVPLRREAEALIQGAGK
jgi:hypothetical protein